MELSIWVVRWRDACGSPDPPSPQPQLQEGKKGEETAVLSDGVWVIGVKFGVHSSKRYMCGGMSSGNMALIKMTLPANRVTVWFKIRLLLQMFQNHPGNGRRFVLVSH